VAIEKAIVLPFVAELSEGLGICFRWWDPGASASRGNHLHYDPDTLVEGGRYLSGFPESRAQTAGGILLFR
jgi:hypothetical protein